MNGWFGCIPGTRQHNPSSEQHAQLAKLALALSRLSKWEAEVRIGGVRGTVRGAEGGLYVLNLVGEDGQTAAHERVAVDPACAVAKLVDSILDHTDLNRVEARQRILVRHDRHRIAAMALPLAHYGKELNVVQHKEISLSLVGTDPHDGRVLEPALFSEDGPEQLGRLGGVCPVEVPHPSVSCVVDLVRTC